MKFTDHSFRAVGRLRRISTRHESTSEARQTGFIFNPLPSCCQNQEVIAGPAGYHRFLGAGDHSAPVPLGASEISTRKVQPVRGRGKVDVPRKILVQKTRERFESDYLESPSFDEEADSPVTETRHGWKGLWIQGTAGYGKSSLLAALTCKLLKGGRRVVYLPNCFDFLDDPVYYIREAFVLAWSGDGQALTELSTAPHRTTSRTSWPPRPRRISRFTGSMTNATRSKRRHPCGLAL